MAAETSIDAVEWLRKQVESAPDPVKEILTEMVGLLLDAEANALCGASFGSRSEGRVNSRNGYRERGWNSRLGTMTLSIPKLRHGSYFPSWLLEPRRRTEKGPVAVIVEAYVQGVSTRRVEDLVQSLGIEKLS